MKMNALFILKGRILMRLKLITHVMHDKQWHSNEPRNDGRHPGVALSGQDFADRSHVVSVAVVVHETVLASEIAGQENPAGFRHVIRIGGQVGNSFAGKLDGFARLEHLSSRS